MFDFATFLARVPEQTVLCIGDLMLDDFIYGEVSRISPEAPVPVIAVKREEKLIGGAGNVACNVASLGARCLFLGVVGEDEAGQTLRAAFARHAGLIEFEPRRRSAPADRAQTAVRVGALFEPSLACRLGGCGPGLRRD